MIIKHVDAYKVQVVDKRFPLRVYPVFFVLAELVVL